MVTRKTATPQKSSDTTPTASRSRAKPSVAKKPAKAPLPKVVKLAEPQEASVDLRKKDLIDRVVERSGIRKRDAKPAVEAALAVLGEALAQGQGWNLPPLGKMRVNRSEEKSNGRVFVCRLRQGLPAGAESAKDPDVAAG